MRIQHKIVSLLCVLALLFCVSGCGSSEAAADAESAAQSAETENSAVQNMAGNDVAETVEEITDTKAAETAAETSSGESGTSILVAYFSVTGNTKPIAEAIAELTGGDLFEIVPADPYTDDDLNYSNDDCRANQEQNDESSRPEISSTVTNMDDYDVVLIGHPIWWGEEPRIIDTFMESYDLSGKTVVNFCTSGGSGVSASMENLKALSPNANWLEGHRFETSADTEIIQACGTRAIMFVSEALASRWRLTALELRGLLTILL